VSASKGDPEGSSYSPSRLKAPSLTFSQFQEIAEFFKQFLESSSLKKWIILAGVGGLVELAHTAWLALRYLAKL
jgi:hypothetical protein